MEIPIYFGGDPEACNSLREWLVYTAHEELIGAFQTKNLAYAWLEHMKYSTDGIKFKRILSWYETTDG